MKRLIKPVTAARKRRRRPKNQRGPVGAPPGFLDRERSIEDAASVQVYDWDADTFRASEAADLAALPEPTGANRWVRIIGHPSREQLQVLHEVFGFHKLALEDVISLDQRPKFERFDDHLFVVFRGIKGTTLPAYVNVETLQFGVLTRPELAVSFELPGSAGAQPIVERFNVAGSRLRNHGCHYLTYRLVDSAVDYWFPAIDGLVEALDKLEGEVLDAENAGDESFLREVHAIKSELTTLRRQISPVREVSSSLSRELGGAGSDLEPFFRDLHDHSTRIVETIDTARDMCDSLFDIALSLAQHRMNDVVKVLTMISTIFIPLSFIAGLYGMNFDPNRAGNMPELGLPYAYPIVLSAMAVVVVALLFLFRRWGWLGGAMAKRRKSPGDGQRR